MRYMVIMGLLMIAWTCDAYAEKMYVSNIIKVTLRTGAGIDHKVIQMLQSGNEVEVIDSGGDWSHVRTNSGKEGWILSRFLSPEMPSDLMLDALQEKYDKLLVRTSVLEEENSKYVQENKRLMSELEQATAALNKISNNYEALKRESADFLALKTKYEEVTANLEKQTRRATELNERLLQRNIKIGLLGAGVLFFGFLIGFSTRKQRKRSSLL